MTVLVTGGAGFIGCNFILDWLCVSKEKVINLDNLTYAANLNNLSRVMNNPLHCFVQGNICDAALVTSLLAQHSPRAIIHFAAESHVDNSIRTPQKFIDTNIVGTFTLLEATRNYLEGLSTTAQNDFRFLHVSTDEIYGSLSPDDPGFTESSPHAPNSPYSASKAASNHLVRAYHHTYGVPTITTNCSNNYGPYQHKEKLIPLMIEHALNGLDLPVYGDGLQIRDWLYVGDHCAALRLILEHGTPGEVFNIGGMTEKTNLEVVRTICTILDKCQPKKDGGSYHGQITFVKDRPGHDRRYAINPTKLIETLNWKPLETFETGLKKTID